MSTRVVHNGPPQWVLDNRLYASMMNPIEVTKDLGRNQVFELGRKAPYHSYNVPEAVEKLLELRKPKSGN